MTSALEAAEGPGDGPHPAPDPLVGLAELAQALRPLDVVARYVQGRSRCRGPHGAPRRGMRGALRGRPATLLRVASGGSGLFRLLGGLQGTTLQLVQRSRCG